MTSLPQVYFIFAESRFIGTATIIRTQNAVDCSLAMCMLKRSSKSNTTITLPKPIDNDKIIDEAIKKSGYSTKGVVYYWSDPINPYRFQSKTP